MNKENITDMLQAIQQIEEANLVIQEVQAELNSIDLDSLIPEVRNLLQKARPSNVVQFPKRIENFATTSLMAASSQKLGNWYEHPILFAASGFIVDIRKVLGSDNEVDIYINPSSEETAEIEKTLSPYKQKTLQVQFSINGNIVLNAEVYVDISGQSAEGSGYLFSMDKEHIDGRLSIDISVKE